MNADTLATIRDCAARGVSFTETAKIAGVSKVTVWRCERRHGIQFCPGAERNGCTREQHKYLTEVAYEMLARGIPRERTPIRAYRLHKRRARMRGIEFHLTVWEWWTIWLNSGRWEQRGTRHDEYVMCRKGDAGPYAVGNVFIDLSSVNVSNGPGRKSNLPIGVARTHYGKFGAARYVNGKRLWLGTFASPELAHEAYVQARPSC